MPPGNHTLNRDQIIVVRFDPTIAAKIYRRKERPAKRNRQKILTYLGRDGEEELFEKRSPFRLACWGRGSPQRHRIGTAD